MARIFDSFHYGYLLRKQPWKLPRQVCRDIKFCGQRLRKGYCEKDTWDIHSWFLEIMPQMLEDYKDNRMGSPGTLGENYTNEKGLLVNDTCHEEWTEILDRMIFLLKEANEETCQKKNPYEEDHHKASKKFHDQYGLFGEGLETEDDKAEREKTGCRRMHFMDELPEYKEISDQYREEERKLGIYRDECKDQFMELFRKWFWDLWD